MCGLKNLVKGLFLNLGGLAHLVAQVIQFSALHVALADHFNLVDFGAVNREGTLYANGKANLSHGKGFAIACAMLTDNVALEHLNTFAITFGNAIVNLDIVTYVKIRNILLNLLLFYCSNNVHC